MEPHRAANAWPGRQGNGNGARPPRDGDDHGLPDRHGAPCLDDLIQAHHERRVTGARGDFARLLAQYRGADREIVDQYFASYVHAGALHVCRRTRFHRRADFEIRMKYPGEKVAVVQPAFEAALWRARAMERQSALVVAGRPRRLLLEMLFSIIVYLLGVLDSLEAAGHGERDIEEPRRVHRIEKAVRIAQRELTRLQHFVDRAAIRSALRYYVLGVFIGGVAVSASAWTTSRIPMFEQTATQDLVRAIAAGGLGAVISVMIRISHGQRLDVDTTQDNVMTCVAGGFRPLIGGALGVALYVLLQAGLTPLEIPEEANDASYFFTAIAFLAGFSERWAQDAIVRSTPLHVSASPSRSPSTSTPLSSEDTDGAVTPPTHDHRPRRSRARPTTGHGTIT
ncbi:hypothetical protein [Geodermatophilus maliterrae]|uniref:Uncharacterized protein n=1 Tax=Geodermatophilus maliterrae TaxID=3162531 RepID=A0ABV3XI90_9ACTN